jgi:hypothetical protein
MSNKGVACTARAHVAEALMWAICLLSWKRLDASSLVPNGAAADPHGGSARACVM